MDSYSIIYEDKDCAVINKPAGVLVHPLQKNDGTKNISAWWTDQEGVAKSGWQNPERAGIVHRLDEGTSGALLLAKTPQVLNDLQYQFKKRLTNKQYLAIVYGAPRPSEGRVVSNISRDKDNRTHRQSKLIDFGTKGKTKKAVSIYKTLATGKIGKDTISTLEFTIKTGRTHQIRAHAKMIGCPILGDNFYYIKPSRRLSKKMKIERCLLHARTLCFVDQQKKKVCITSPLPKDIQKFIHTKNTSI